METGPLSYSIPQNLPSRLLTKTRVDAKFCLRNFVSNNLTNGMETGTLRLVFLKKTRMDTKFCFAKFRIRDNWKHCYGNWPTLIPSLIFRLVFLSFPLIYFPFPISKFSPKTLQSVMPPNDGQFEIFCIEILYSKV
jgi:hypothetical protein